MNRKFTKINAHLLLSQALVAFFPLTVHVFVFGSGPAVHLQASLEILLCKLIPQWAGTKCFVARCPASK